MGSPEKPNIFERSFNTIKAIGVWLLFFTVCFFLGVWAWLFIIYDWQTVLFGSVVATYLLLRLVKRVFSWLNGKDDEKLVQQLGLKSDTTPQKEGKKPDFIPPPLVVGECEVKKDIYDSIVSFLHLYGELNYRDENTLKRVIESCIFREVSRGELEYTLHVMHKAKRIFVKNHIITLDDPLQEAPKEKLYPGMNKIVWNINLLLIQIYGFEEFHQKSDEIFEKYNISDLPQVMETLRESADFSKSRIMFYHFNGQKKKPSSSKPMQKVSNTVNEESSIEEPKITIPSPVVQQPDPQTEFRTDDDMSPRLKKRLEMMQRLAEIDKEFESNAPKE